MGKDALDATGKCIALLWQLALVDGVDVLPHAVLRIVSILTDNGVERLVAGIPWFMKEPLEFVHAKVPRALIETTHMFPRALRLEERCKV